MATVSNLTNPTSPMAIRQPFVLRAALVCGSMTAIAAPLLVLSPAPGYLNDPDLARLLRFLGAVKFSLLVPFFVLAWVRFGHPIGKRLTVAYVASLAVAWTGCATMMSLTSLGPGAALFHGGWLMMVLIASKDPGFVPSLLVFKRQK